MMTRVALGLVGLMVHAAEFWNHQRMTRLELRLQSMEEIFSSAAGRGGPDLDASDSRTRMQRPEERDGDSQRSEELRRLPDSGPGPDAPPRVPASVVPTLTSPPTSWEWTAESLATIRGTAGFESFEHGVREATLEILMRLPRSPSLAELLGVAVAVRSWRADSAGLDSLPDPERNRRREESDQRFRAHLQAHFPGPEGVTLSSGLVSRSPP